MDHSERIRVGIVGATGYGGQELIRLILGHPGAHLTYLGATSDVPDAMAVFPQFTGAPLPKIQAYDREACAKACDTVFVALPSGSSGDVAAQLWEQGCRVIDLSGDLRLPANAYETWYSKTAVAAKYLETATYGLSEWHREHIRESTLVANPGCYATAVLLALLPLARQGIFTSGTAVTVDAKSGVSGAGRGPKLAHQLAELADNFFPYRVGSHQHTPEVEQELGAGARVLLTTQLLPMTRGIFASIYIPWSRDVSEADVREIFVGAYEHEPFVTLLPDAAVPQLKAVRGSNSCHLQVHLDSRTETLMVFSAIDNLQKGAAGQAVQNFNLMHGLPETMGLSRYGVSP
ncbi:N-acetyl-gamma-glutamyl-phosphate reductase [Alicyclobacillus curvatus]|jgi:N-acetyl-gamma-glutamyl-phosphate reductase|nr:N-acetyl-gamma-glutamyl-phosphate reductase [Alicyclobacillus curvatus]